MCIKFFEKIKDYAKEHDINRFELEERISIAAVEVLKDSKLKRVGIARVQKNILNVSEIFIDGFSNISEIEPYLHKETKELIEKSIELVLTNNIPRKMSKFSTKNRIVGVSLTIFLDWLIFGNSIFSE